VDHAIPGDAQGRRGHPGNLRIRLELSPPIRIHFMQSHLVIYKTEEDGTILFVRVRHGHEDWAEPMADL
jgi:toxin ParE1/3/4